MWRYFELVTRSEPDEVSGAKERVEAGRDEPPGRQGKAGP